MVDNSRLSATSYGISARNPAQLPRVTVHDAELNSHALQQGTDTWHTISANLAELQNQTDNEVYQHRSDA
jgi:hypothetical protein